MKQLYYSLITLVRGKGSNIIKIISLTLGLFVSILLFTRVAFELSYNTGYNDADKLYSIMGTYTIGDKKQETPSNILFGPVTYAVRDAFPEEIEYASVTQYRWGTSNYFLGEASFPDQTTILGDSLFFSTMGIPVLEGSILDLNIPDVVFISDKLAKRIFGSESPLGKTISRNKEQEITVRGVFKSVEENNSMRPDVVMSFITREKYNWGYYGWGGGDSYQGFVRLRDVNDLEKINQQINTIIQQYDPFEPEKTGFAAEYHLLPLRELQSIGGHQKRMITIMTLLGIAILLIASLNYVLISISSLVTRAKGIGVHKCNGASAGNIFSMFLWETFIIILLSLLLGFVLLITFRPVIEEVLEVTLSGLFMWKTLWGPLVVIFLVFIVAGIIPGKIFSSIPVTQVFRNYANAKSSWKRPLLFIQFGGVSFVFGLLCVVLLQYKEVMNYDLGYNEKGIASAYKFSLNRDNVTATLKNLPMVESLTFSDSRMATGLSGEMIFGSDGKGLFSTRYNITDKDYISVMGLQIIEGKGLEKNGDIVVNEEFVRQMHWTDGGTGKVVNVGGSIGRVTVVGVLKDYIHTSLFTPPQPLALFCLPEHTHVINVRLKPPFRENLGALNDAVQEIYPNHPIAFNYLPDHIKGQYDSIRRFRDLVLLAFVSILLITLMGLIGYVNDEVRRRSKEIAIRKVNGAEASDIIKILSNDVAWVALPGVVLGTIGAYFMGQEWLSQFEFFRITELMPLLIISTLVVLLIIFGSVIIKSYKIANEDPVKSIKSE